MRFESDYEFPAVIVWDALVDAELVSGWLAEATVTAGLEGEYTLHISRPGHSLFAGRVTGIRPRELLRVEDEGGVIEFSLDELEGGSRGTSTHLTVVVEARMNRQFSASLQADWLVNLEQLEDLLRGHPVDWAHWRRDREAGWARHLEEVQGRHSSSLS